MPDSGGAQGPRRPAVSVVVPAYNAERTLSATLDSVCAQTLDDFEVIVVDDGSTDRTRAMAEEYARRDPRFRVVSQPNGGVADARNAGLHLARAPLVAPLDADDLWHATYLEKLHGALVAGGPEVLFAYANFRIIDLNGQVVRSAPQYDVEGSVFHRFLLQNFVGNGSGMVFRRDAAIAVGGYDRRLQHEFGAQGCEDLLLQLRLAARGSVVVVSEYLVGYRTVPGAMSSDRNRMWRSRVHALGILFDEVDVAGQRAARWAQGCTHAQRMIHQIVAGEIGAAMGSLGRALVQDPVGTVETIAVGTYRAMKRRVGQWIRPLRSAEPARPFHECHPRQDRQRLRRGLLKRRLRRLEDVDRRARSERPSSADRRPGVPSA